MDSRRTRSAAARRCGPVLALLVLGVLPGTVVAAPAVAATGDASRTRHLRVGLYENAPKISSDGAGGAAGIFPEILAEIARAEGWRLTYVPCAWEACLEMLADGRIDLMPDVAFSPERSRVFDFPAEEVVSSWSVLYARRGVRIGAISDLDGLRVAVLRSSIQETVLKRMVQGFGYRVAFVEAGAFAEAYRLVADGAADAVAVNHFSGETQYRRHGLVKTPIVFNPVSLYFATARGASPGVLAAIDARLRAMKDEPESGYYRALLRWMDRPPRAIVPPRLAWAIGGVSGLLLLAVAFIVLLRWQLGIQTRHLAESNRLLRESEGKFRDLFHEHAAVKLLIDPADGRIVEANQAAATFYGWSGEQLRGKRIQELSVLPPGEVEAQLRRALDEHSVHVEHRHRLADGSVRDVAVFSSRIDVRGRPLLHAIVHDITEHRRLEDQLRQSQKMESVGRLAGGVAHDYNNMLSVILGYTQMALRETDPAGAVHGHLEEVFKAARHSAEITRQLLAFARKQTVSPRTLDLNETVAGMLKMLRRLMGENIDLAWIPTAGLWPVRVDPGQIDQILANLCVNARDAIADVGKVTIETRNVVVDAAYCAEHAGFLPGEFVLLAVSDTGCGMERGTVERMFEPFFTTKGAGAGTGLGLATVYGIVKQNRGFINVYSEPGQGTTLRLYLPRHAGAVEAAGDEGAAEPPRGSGETVLLVEDDGAILRMCRRMLEELGYRVLEAGTPEEALRLGSGRAEAVDLLLTDVVLPGMSGRDLAERLRAARPGLGTLFMSGYAAGAIVHRDELAEGVNFLQKPFSEHDLAVAVRRSLGPRSAER